jgi:hypothetical protein
MSRTYVPGYGYVDSTGPGTSGSVTKGPKRRSTGQEPRRPAAAPTSSGSQGTGNAVTGQAWRNYTASTSAATPSAVVTTSSGSPQAPAYLRYDVSYRPPVWGTADQQERQIPSLPLVYRAQTSGDLREAYWADPESRAFIQAAARVYYRDYPNYNDQWAEKFWQEDILGASLNPGSPPPWQMLQQIFGGTRSASASDVPGGSGSYSSYGGGGYGGGGSAGGGSVSLTDPTSARGLLMQTMQNVLGRNPSDQEYRQFLKALGQAEMNAPRTVDIEGDIAVQSGGVDPGMVAMEYVEGLEEFDSAAGQRTLDAFMQVLGA